MKKLILALLPVIFAATGLKAKTFNDSIPPGKNFNKAVFRLWHSDHATTLRGILLLVPGSNTDGRGMADDTMWQNYAARFDFAVLACYYTDPHHEDPSIESYVNVKDGSGQALIDVLTLFSKKTGHAELASLPMACWGISAGGQFNYELVCWKPERIIAFVVNKGGVYFSALASKEARMVPGILFIGEQDIEFRNNIIMGIFSVNRRYGALWAVAVEPGRKHEIGNSISYTKKFFEVIIPMRLRSDGSLISLNESSGFICDSKTNTCEPFSSWQKKEYPTSWLPDEEMTKVWRSVNGK